MTAAHVAIIGASLAGLRSAQALRARGYQGRITLIGDEMASPYNRPPLSKAVLRGEASTPDIALLRPGEVLDVDWRLGSRAIGMSAKEGWIVLSSGERVSFDRAIVATGASCRLPSLAGIDMPGVHFLRTLEDALGLRESLLAARRIVVIGAGFIGCEVASSAMEMGIDVTIVDPAQVPMARVLGLEIGQRMRRLHEANGSRWLLGRQVIALVGEGRVRSVVLDDGSRLQADAVVVGVGSVPGTGWLAGTDIPTENGVMCDEACRVYGTDGRVAAAGDVANWPHLGYGGMRMRVEHWTQAAEQAQAAAEAVLSDATPAPFMPLLSVWSDQCGMKLQVLGAPWLGERLEVTEGPDGTSRFAATFWRQDELMGVAALSMPGRLAAYRQALLDGMVLRRERAAEEMAGVAS